MKTFGFQTFPTKEPTRQAAGKSLRYYKHDNHYYLIMYKVEGIELQRYLNKLKPGEYIPVKKALRIIKSILENVAAAHSEKIIHADIKPENFILRPNGDVKLIDFDTAFPLDAGSITKTTKHYIGTLPFFAPECKQKTYGYPSDIYATGKSISLVLEKTNLTCSLLDTSIKEQLAKLLSGMLAPKIRLRKSDIRKYLIDLNAITGTSDSRHKRARTPLTARENKMPIKIKPGVFRGPYKSSATGKENQSSRRRRALETPSPQQEAARPYPYSFANNSRVSMFQPYKPKQSKRGHNESLPLTFKLR